MHFPPRCVSFLHYSRESSLSPPSLYRFRYARVSSVGQNLDSQVDALQKAECEKIFSDKTTGSRMDRPGWDQLMEYVRPPIRW